MIKNKTKQNKTKKKQLLTFSLSFNVALVHKWNKKDLHVEVFSFIFLFFLPSHKPSNSYVSSKKYAFFQVKTPDGVKCVCLGI